MADCIPEKRPYITPTAEVLDYAEAAEEKLRQQAGGCKAQQCVAQAVLDALINFCHQNSDFAKQVYDSEKDFNGCMDAVLKNHGACLSDLEAYRRAASFYFEDADVYAEMTLLLPQTDPVEGGYKGIVLDLFSGW